MKPLRNLFLVLTCLCLTALTSPCFAGDEASFIPVQHNGRVKPFEAFARQTLKLVANKSVWEKKSATTMIAAWINAPEKIASERWIRVDFEELKKTLKLSKTEHFFTYNDIYPEIDRVRSLIRSAKQKRDLDQRPSKLEQKAEELYNKIHAVESLVSGDSPSVLPQKDGVWTSLTHVSPKDAQSFRSALLSDTHAKDWIRRVSPESAVSTGRIQAEVFYYKFMPFEWAAGFYFAAFLLMTLAIPSNRIRSIGTLLAIVGIVTHTLGLGMRVYILSRPPVSNMFESMIFMNWALMIYATIFSVMRRSTVALSMGALVSGLVMVYGYLLPIDSSLEVLVPVLRSNYWLTIHVMTIVSSYGAFGLAMALGHRHLIGTVLRRSWDPKKEAESASLIFRVIQLGTLLIGVGTFLGGVWANESWGRFWGWDPKETWAFITFLGYLLVVHLHYAKKLSHFWLAMSSLLGFLLVLMTWYGVNFVLGRGLHSYGQGAGGMQWVTYYLIAEFIFITLVLIKKKTR